MNERIQKLMVETDAWCDQLELTDQNKYNQIWEKTFAELIIRECGIVGDNWVNNEGNGKNRIGDKFKQHFGIK